METKNLNIKFKVEYRTKWGETLGVSVSQSGNAPVDVPLSTNDGVIWMGKICMPDASDDVIAYRYYVNNYGQRVRTEVAVMPHLIFPEKEQSEYVQEDAWSEPERIAGIAVPVFSLRSEGSAGVGDFGDLKALIDWTEMVGMKAVQILPVNDTTNTHTWMDSYPYNSISVYAFHPMYLDLRQLGRLSDDAAMNEFEMQRRRLNMLPQLDYEEVNQLKQKYIRAKYKEDGAQVLQSEGYNTFYEHNEYWLKPYAAFSFLRDLYGTADFSAWDNYRTYQPEMIDRLMSEKKEDTSYYCYVQYLLHLQLLDAGNYARQKNIILKGDIPIGVCRCSVGTWAEPYYFNMEEQTGAPPDFFSDNGQNWGFPTYNWDIMATDDYRWWRRRMSKMSEYFSAYRIDHILGFFRIWEIPVPYKSGLVGHFSPALPMSPQEIEERGVPFIEDMYIKDPKEPSRYHLRISAKKERSYNFLLTEQERHAFDALYEDFFYHRHTQFWYNEAMKKLPVLTRSNQMIACGEDLGMIPECVPWVMRQLGILSLEIQSMPKAMGHEFGVLSDNPVLSVCTISSHDTPSLRGWWEENADRSQRYYNNVLGLEGKAPESAPGWLCEKILRMHLECPSALCILTLQDWLSVDESVRCADVESERINIPANPRHYWRYRMHLTIEQLMGCTALNSKIHELISSSRS